MDFLKKAQGMMGENSGNNQAATQQAGAAGEQGQMGAQGQAMGNNQNEDYGDKGLFSSLLRLLSVLRHKKGGLLTQERTGLDFIQKKTGHTLGRDTNEKITDGARGLFEKATG
jgi:hypothetical protein